jgi:DNA polymerase-4
MMLNPALRNKAVAVCGSTESRHGIVLAKSELAKKKGVKTGMVNWEARQCCPGIIMVPPQRRVSKYSKLTRAIYERYTDQVEGYGMDECWVDVSGSRTMFGDGMKIAEEIRETVKAELGLTVSIGVSFNKIFAKLGSDMKKPDAITAISTDDFKEKIWPLPASDLLYVGRATTKKFDSYGIHTIGDIANQSQDFLKRLLGVNGLALWSYANGLDSSRVMPGDYESPVKSVGHGITCNADLDNKI